MQLLTVLAFISQVISAHELGDAQRIIEQVREKPLRAGSLVAGQIGQELINDGFVVIPEGESVLAVLWLKNQDELQGERDAGAQKQLGQIVKGLKKRFANLRVQSDIGSPILVQKAGDAAAYRVMADFKAGTQEHLPKLTSAQRWAAQWLPDAEYQMAFVDRDKSFFFVQSGVRRGDAYYFRIFSNGAVIKNTGNDYRSDDRICDTGTQFVNAGEFDLSHADISAGFIYGPTTREWFKDICRGFLSTFISKKSESFFADLKRKQP